MPKLGERFDDGVGHVLEWAGEVWAPVCPTDDVAMSAHDGRGWLCCAACGVRSVDARRAA